jgi:putative tryptophan/tyrosine transport system substrate-binding protein
MRRRNFLTGLGLTLACPTAIYAQQIAKVRLVGALLGITEGKPEGNAWVMALRAGLAEKGWTEGRNLQLEIRWPAADPSLMQLQAIELRKIGCEVVITHATPATLAWRKAAPLIPNVFVAVVDPIASGFVETIAHPGGNSTGFTNFEPSMGGKWLELLKEVWPSCAKAAVMLNPETFPGGFNSPHVRAIFDAANSIGMTAIRLPFADSEDIESGLAALDKATTGLIVVPDTSTTQFSTLIVKTAERLRIPAIYPYRDFVNSGGLICYGVDRTDLYRRAAGYVDRMLRGEKPSNLPVQAPVKFELIINQKAAKALGIALGPTLLARADEVVE